MLYDDHVALRPLFDKESSTYTYLLWDRATKDAVIIDPVKEMLERDIEVIQQLDLSIRYGLETHLHADHITSLGTLAEHFKFKKVLSAHAKTDCADLEVREGDCLEVTEKFSIKVIETPGHTDCSVSF